ncbi:FIST N-terminal domain-containing protein [Geitlerinema sp. PCC 9228]|jgi:small ligand-binding sensory domain FIST|uniref:FIST signal transduction protein n=1 Tax=Geitlerinema sp. PCC 9228 TaxID=111611 RepID=UPI0008F9E3BD|nr:FIST N-terminal domain-containing protein [Geitlerinema sp. PCC 9228]
MTEQMQWTNALSTRPSLEEAVKEVSATAQQQLYATPDLAIVFISAAFASECTRLMPLLQAQLPEGTTVVGCVGGGVVAVDGDGNPTELEEKPAISLTLAYLPRVEVRAFHLTAEGLPDLDAPPNRWVELTGVSQEPEPTFVILADPFTSKIYDVLQGLDYAYPKSVKLGGLASGGVGTQTGLFSNGQLYRGGTVGVALSGEIQVDTIVAQGCRPIGPVYRVTEGERNILLGLEPVSGDAAGGSQVQTPLEALRELVQSLDERDRELAQNSLFVGVVRDEFKSDLQHGDFLIRNLLGIDPKQGAMALGDRIRVGQRIQFHLRDAQTSAEDLEMLLEQYKLRDRNPPVGALMFACLGRGSNLYKQPNFDSSLFFQYAGAMPLGGFFCNGEIGPVGEGTFLHGYTSVFGIFSRPQAKKETSSATS